MPETSYLAWRLKGSRNFTTTWHLVTDNRFTLCGRRPPMPAEGLLSVWRGKQPPQVEQQCMVCRQRESQERNPHAVP